MRYNKPELVVLTRAVDAIESGIVKPDFYTDNQDPRLGLATSAAYESDE